MKIIVVGGVALGATFSTRMRRLSEEHEIVIYEKSGAISYANCGLPYNLSGKIAREKLEVATPESLKKDFNIDVNTKHEVIKIDRKAKKVIIKDLSSGKEFEDNYDKLILGPGTSALTLPIPGMKEEKAVFTLKNLDDLDKINQYIEDNKPKRAVIFGAGFIGLEVAESLIEAGWDVSVIDIANTIVKLDDDISPIAENELTDNGVKLFLKAFTEKIDSKSKHIVLKDGRKIPYDVIFSTAGIKPNTDFIKEAGIEVDERGIVITNEHMQTSDQDVYAGGDIVYSKHIVTGKTVYSPLAWGANRQARVIANHIAGIEDKQPPTFNTAIIKIFRKSVAQTGLSEFLAKNEGFDVDTALINANHHAGYYPGAKKVVLKLIFDKKTKRVLGAQAVGEGADKKIDVIATSLQAKATIYDLMDLNLSYSPPYGSARDVVNVVASVAINKLERKIDYVKPLDIPKGSTIVDVRPETVFSIGTIDNAINIDQGLLRSSDKLPKDKNEKIYLLCATGHTSYNAWSVLSAMGYKKLVNIQGGYGQYKDLIKAKKYEPNLTKTNVKAANKTTSPITKQQSVDLGNAVNVDCTGLSCPGPILKVAEELKKVKDGDVLKITASDFGFETDIKTWTTKNGHTLQSISSDDNNVYATIIKGKNNSGSNLIDEDTKAMASAMLNGKKKATIVLFSGSYDKSIAAFIIAQAAASLGTEVTIFSTFWGLTTLRKKKASKKIKKSFGEKMFGFMLPKGVRKQPLSQMNMGGMGKAMIKKIMKKHNVTTPEEMLHQSLDMGVKIIACTMSMDLMGLKKEELVDGISFGGAAAYVSESDDSNLTIFI